MHQGFLSLFYLFQPSNYYYMLRTYSTFLYVGYAQMYSTMQYVAVRIQLLIPFEFIREVVHRIHLVVRRYMKQVLDVLIQLTVILLHSY